MDLKSIMSETQASLPPNPTLGTAFAFSSDKITEEGLPVGSGVTKQVLIGSEQAPNFALRKFRIAPNGFMPLHSNTVEHEQYVLEGSATITLGEKQLTVTAGDTVYIPAGLPHSYQTVGDKPFVFLCIVPNAKDQITVISEGC